MQKGRVANKINSSHQPTDHSRTPGDHHKSALQEANEARRKAAAAAENRQRLSTLNKEPARTADKTHEQQRDESRAEQQAWRDRALATAPRRKSPTKVIKRAPASASILSKLSADAKRERDRRARALKDRNERMREAAAEEDEATKAQTQREAERNHALSAPKAYESIRAKKAFDEIANGGPKTSAVAHAQSRQSLTPEREFPATAEPSPLHLDRSQGPFPANSTPGVEALKKSMPRPPVLPYDDVPSTTTAQRFIGNKPTKISFKKSKANIENRPITANDLQLYQWRQQKRRWAEVIQLYADLTNTAPWTEDHLRTRFRYVERVLSGDDIPEDLCDRVMDGDEDAERELNRLVNLQGPEPSLRVGSVIPTAFKKIAKQDRALAAPSIGPPPAPRPTQGGKCFDNDAYMALLTQARETWMADSDSEEDLPRYSPPRDADCVYWEYFMQRRDFTSSDLAEHGYEMLDEETEWREYNAAFENAGEANAEASKWIFTVPEGSGTLVTTRKGQLKYDHTDEEGMAMLDLTSAMGDLVQVRVRRRMLTFQDHVMPESKEGWTPRTVYCVKVKTCKKSTEDLFEEPEDKTYLLDEEAYGSLDQANSRAMDEWIRLTFKIRSVNLDEIARKRGELKQEMQREFEGESEGNERARFSASMDDDERAVEVAVKPLSMQGPRN